VHLDKSQNINIVDV